MTYLSKELGQILREENKKQIELARASGVSHTVISRFLSEQKKISTQTIRELIQVAGDKVTRERLIVAHLRDEAEALGHDPDNVHYGSEIGGSNIDPKLSPLFRRIQELAPNNPLLVKHISLTLKLLIANDQELEKTGLKA